MGRKRKTIEGLSIIDIADKGKGIGKNMGHVIFVDDAVPGDEEDVLITKKRNSYMEGRILKMVKPSDMRREHFCTHFGTCGGCKWQHLEYSKQLEFKHKLVLDAIERIGGAKDFLVDPILSSPSNTHYRNKMEYTFSNSRWLTDTEIQTEEKIDRNALGFHVGGMFNRIVHIDRCYLQNEKGDQIRKLLFDLALKENWTFYDPKSHKGLLRNLVLKSNEKGMFMVVVIVGEPDVKAMNTMRDALIEKLPFVQSIYWVVNPKLNDTWIDLACQLIHGEQYLIEELGDKKFNIGPKSFFQVNIPQTIALYDTIVEFAEFSGNETVLDLYCGVGSISLYMADKVKKVLGIEVVPEAIDLAKANAQLNKVLNIDFMLGDIKDCVQEWEKGKLSYPDVLVTDPPRTGMHPAVIDFILKSGVKKMVYVSCNAATQARDIKLLSEKYQLKKIRPVDMFPHTHHVENVALLEMRV